MYVLGIYVYRDKARHPRAVRARGGVVYRAYVPYLGMIYVICVTEECNYVLGDSVRGPVQLSAAFLPLSVLFRDSMTAVNYGWTLSASCCQQQRTLEGW